MGAVECFEDALCCGVAEGEFGGPLAGDSVQGVFLPSTWVYHSAEARLFALPQPSAPGVVDSSAKA